MEKELIMYAFIWFILIIIFSSWWSKKPVNRNINNWNWAKIEKFYNLITKENRNLEWLSIKIDEIRNEIDVLRYEWDEDLEKADINELKVRKLILKTQHLEDKIFQKRAYIQDLEKEINSLRI